MSLRAANLLLLQRLAAAGSTLLQPLQRFRAPLCGSVLRNESPSDHRAGSVVVVIVAVVMAGEVVVVVVLVCCVCRVHAI